jgi:hypothetical protein
MKRYREDAWERGMRVQDVIWRTGRLAATTRVQWLGAKGRITGDDSRDSSRGNVRL